MKRTLVLMAGLVAGVSVAWATPSSADTNWMPFGSLIGSHEAVGDDSQLEYALSVGADDGNGIHVAVSGPAAILAQNDAGRGAELRGTTAQLRLVPSTAPTHPKKGEVGDLFIDKSGRLWYCKGGTSWKQLA